MSDPRKVEIIPPKPEYRYVDRGYARLHAEHDSSEAMDARMDWTKTYNDKLEAVKKEAILKAAEKAVLERKQKSAGMLWFIVLLFLLAPFIALFEYSIYLKITGG